MAILITNNESNISRRVIPISAISQSNGTSPCTNEAAGQPQWMMGGVYKGNTTNTLSASSANRGEYYVTLTQSEVSVVGQGVVYYSSSTALEWATPFQVVAFDSGDSVGLGLSGVTVGAIKAATYSGVTLGVNNIAAGTYSGVTIQGESNGSSIAAYVWDEPRSLHSISLSFGGAAQVVSVAATNGPGSSSVITLASTETKVDNFYKGCLIMVQYPDGSRAGGFVSAYSGSSQSATFVGPLPVAVPSGSTYIIYPGQDAAGVSVWSSYLTRQLTAGDFGSSITFGVSAIKAGTYSGVTVGSAATILAGTYSGVTLGVNNIAAGTYSGVTTAGLSSGGNQAIANSLLSTNVGNSRLVQEYLWPLRNKVAIQASTMTVFNPDDVTSAWTASLTTGTITITTMDPQG